MVCLKFVALLGLFAAASAAPRPQDWVADNTTPFELRKMVTTTYSRGDTSLSFIMMDPDTQMYGRCSALWRSHNNPPEGWIGCTNEFFAFRFQGYTNVTTFQLQMRQVCGPESEEGCQTELGSAGLVSDDPRWRIQPGSNKTTSAYYKGTISVPVYPEWAEDGYY